MTCHRHSCCDSSLYLGISSNDGAFRPRVWSFDYSFNCLSVLNQDYGLDRKGPLWDALTDLDV